MENEGICSVKDVKEFIEKYKILRKDYLMLHTLNSESGKLSNIQVKNPPYEKFEKLCSFLETRDYSLYGPLKGLDLRRNGFADLLESFNLVDSSVSDWCHQDLDIYAIKDRDYVNCGILASRLIRIEIYNALLPQLQENTSYKFSWVFDELEKDSLFNKTRCCSEFLEYSRRLEQEHPYVDLIISKSPFNEFFPSICIYIVGRPYVSFSQANIGVPYDKEEYRAIPKYTVKDNFYDYNCCEILDIRNRCILKDTFSSLKLAMDSLFSLPQKYEEDEKIIMQEYKAYFGENTNDVKILYDWVKECYCFDPDSENRIFGKYIETKSEDKYLCKYTTVGTLKSVIESGKMRLNTIVGMNDPTEVSKLDGEGCNFEEREDCQQAAQKYSNYYFITSFTSLEDNLSMWRLYGDRAEGICLVFEPIEDAKDPVFDVYYLKSYSIIKNKIDRFLDSLKEKNIRFCIQSFVSKLLFIKPDGYEPENERRLVITDDHPKEYALYPNNVLVPYIERKLSNNKEEYIDSPEKNYPLMLRKIILGPVLPNKDNFKRQLELMINNKLSHHEKIDVIFSKIDYYRN